MAYDIIVEVDKGIDVIEEIEKFNPYHDAKGRFATADGYTSFTYAPGKSKAHDLAIAREKERQTQGAKKKLSFSTVKEAEQWARDNGVKFASYEKFDLETATTINNALNTLPDGVRPLSVTDYTTFKQGFGTQQWKVVSRGRKDANTYGVTVDTIGSVNFGNGNLFPDGGVMVGFNTRNFKNAAAIQTSKDTTNAAYKARTGNEWHFNKTGDSTYYHEIGHVYAKVKGIPDGFSQASSKWHKESGCDILRSDSEAWAEAWAAYHTGNTSLPGYIAQYIANA